MHLYLIWTLCHQEIPVIRYYPNTVPNQPLHVFASTFLEFKRCVKRIHHEMLSPFAEICLFLVNSPGATKFA